MWWDRHHQKYTYVSCGMKMMTWLDFCLIPRNPTVLRNLNFRRKIKMIPLSGKAKPRGQVWLFFCKVSSRSSNNVGIRLSSFSIFVHPPWKLKVTGWEREMSVDYMFLAEFESPCFLGSLSVFHMCKELYT